MSHTNKCIGLLVALALTALCGAYAAETLPYVEGFETPDEGDLPGGNWTQSGAGTAVVAAAAAKLDLKGLSVLDTSLTLSVAGTNNAWVHMLVKPSAFEEDPDSFDGAASVAFYLKDDGVLRAYSGSGWVDATNGVPTNKWLGFVVHLDYPTSSWDLFVNTNLVYASSTWDITDFKRVPVSPLAMSDGRTETAGLKEIAFDSELAMYLDGVAVSHGYTPVGVAGLDYVKVRPLDAGANGINEFVVNLGTHATSEDRLNQRLGQNLLTGVTVGDELINIGTNGPSLYRVITGSPWAWSRITGTFIDDMDFAMGTGATLDRTNTTQDALAFFEYTGTLLDPPPQQTLVGTDVGQGGNAYGWNQLVNPVSNGDLIGSGSTTDAVDVFPNAESGDVLWWKDGDDFYKWVYLNGAWDTSQGDIPAGALMWYQHRADAPVIWEPNIND